jgi:type IV pilus assembly protein PilX
MTSARGTYPVSFGSQRGLALIVALIALIAMTLAGVALVRSVDTNSLVASNMTFRQTARESTDAGLEFARGWVMAQALLSDTALDANNSSNGYFAMRSGLNLTGNDTGTDIAWQNNDGSTSAGAAHPNCLPQDPGGNVVCFVVQRMCDGTGPMNKDTCDVATVTSDGGDASTAPVSTGPAVVPPPSWVAVYRINVRASGPRNNVSITQVFVAL